MNETNAMNALCNCGHPESWHRRKPPNYKMPQKRPCADRDCGCRHFTQAVKPTKRPKLGVATLIMRTFPGSQFLGIHQKGEL
jgi:hypothetical protein